MIIADQQRVEGERHAQKRQKSKRRLHFSPSTSSSTYIHTCHQSWGRSRSVTRTLVTVTSVTWSLWPVWPGIQLDRQTAATQLALASIQCNDLNFAPNGKIRETEKTQQQQQDEEDHSQCRQWMTRVSRYFCNFLYRGAPSVLLEEFSVGCIGSWTHHWAENLTTHQPNWYLQYHEDEQRSLHTEGIFQANT